MKTKLILLIFFIPLLLSAQDEQNFTNEIIHLAKLYRNHHVGGKLDMDESKALAKHKIPELSETKKILLILSDDYNLKKWKKILVKPDEVTLKNLYIIRTVNWGFYDDTPPEESELKSIVEALVNEETNPLELLSCYYDMVFMHITNKHRPFNMAKVNFNIEAYNLANDTEKSVFFLESMEAFGTLIWGYMNVPNPPNFDKALEFIHKYPRYNGQEYFEYINLDMDDFLVTINSDEPKKSFKKYHLNKLMNTVLYHVLCLVQKEKYAEQKMDVLSNSIIRNESFWQYSETPEIFQKIYGKRE